uniref:Eukaryotic translation initiation factor 5b isoform x1 n=1 Tax=Triatoma infestans TaxID=30076 RepID=A0A161MCG3_TRIIF
MFYMKLFTNTSCFYLNSTFFIRIKNR